MKYSIILLLSFWGAAANCETLFPNSVVSNDIDFIRVNDHTENSDLKFVGIERKEMPDRRTSELFDNSAFVFSAEYDDGTSLGIWASSEFINRSEAEGYVRRVLGPVGKLRKRSGIDVIPFSGLSRETVLSLARASIPRCLTPIPPDQKPSTGSTGSTISMPGAPVGLAAQSTVARTG